MTIQRSLIGVVAVIGLGLSASALTAQVQDAQVRDTPGRDAPGRDAPTAGAGERSRTGWIGISFDLPVVGPDAPATPGAAGPAGGVPVRDVYDGSPADRAGIRPGSVILRIDDQEATPALLVDRARELEVGETITFRVRTDDSVREVRLEAGARPEGTLALGDEEVQARIDSLWDGMLRQIDSVRILIRERRTDSPVRIVTPAGSSTTVITTLDGAPSVAHRLRELQTELMQVQSDRARLRGQIEAARRRGRAARDGTEERLRSLDREARSLEEALREVYLDLSRRDETNRSGAASSRRSVIPRAPYAAGRDFVAGARLSTLNPSLSEYFGGVQGVLVLEVLESSPAGQAGLVPGDVITEVDGRAFESVEELRAILIGLGTDAVNLRVFRQGEALSVQLPR